MKRTNTVNAPRALDIKGQPHQLSYITSEEAEVLKALGGSGKPGPMGIPSFFRDDDEEEAELAASMSDTGSYTTSGGGTSTNFSWSDGGGGGGGGSSENFTRGESQVGGGTKITGNKIIGGRIISDTTIGRGDYDRNSQQYKDYLEQTGRSLQNPYGNTGIFSNIFGADKVNYNLDPTTAQNILDAGFQRFSDFEGQDELSQRRGFGKLFGGPEGEMTAQGEVRKQITPMTTEESMGRALASVMGFGLPLSMIEGGNVGYAPMGARGPDGERLYNQRVGEVQNGKQNPLRLPALVHAHHQVGNESSEHRVKENLQCPVKDQSDNAHWLLHQVFWVVLIGISVRDRNVLRRK